MIEWHKRGKFNFTKNESGIIGRLPRAYKDKLFSKPLRESMAAESIALSDELYYDEIMRLSSLADDPAAYYDERDRYNHDAITSKVNSLNKF